MALLTQLLGNRQLAFEDQLEKGRIWVFGDGNEYTGLCNGFCWKPPGFGIAVIEIYGPGGSTGRGCCCGGAVPGNPGAVSRKCICVCPTNYVCGSIGRGCGATPEYNRGDDPESVGLCWFGCAIHPLFEGGYNPAQTQKSWRGNNPWGWGNGEPMGSQPMNDTSTAARFFNPADTGCLRRVCCTAGATRGCMCAQGGAGGTFYCSNDAMTSYLCFARNRYCGQLIGTAEICGALANGTCGITCNVGAECVQWNMRGIKCAFGGDLNCCGVFSCTRWLDCVRNQASCRWQYHQATPPLRYSSEGGVYTYIGEHDSPSSRVSGSNALTQMAGIQTLARDPSYVQPVWCWSGGVGCGCYEAFGCVAWAPSGMGGYPSAVCGDVRDHGGRGGNGSVRIRYTPTDGGSAY